jgi:hypothetical protein
MIIKSCFLFGSLEDTYNHIDNLVCDFECGLDRLSKMTTQEQNFSISLLGTFKNTCINIVTVYTLRTHCTQYID